MNSALYGFGVGHLMGLGLGVGHSMGFRLVWFVPIAKFGAGSPHVVFGDGGRWSGL